MIDRRRQYLDAMGIDVWVARDGPLSAGTGLPECADDTASTHGPDPVAEPPPASGTTAPAGSQPARAGRDGSAVTATQPVHPKHDSADLDIVPGGSAIGTATDLQTDWRRLQVSVSRCTACDLHLTRTRTVFGVGNPDADWLFIGEAPGADEDRQGEPFVGRAGQLLDAMLEAVGKSRDEVFIANVLKCRPPGNRDPRVEETAACRPYLDAQIRHIAPRLIIALGRVAAQSLLATDRPLGRLRGQTHYYGETDPIPLVVTYHPAYLLRSPQQKRKTWEDLLYAIKLTSELKTP